MAEAILLTRNLSASSHKGVTSLFGEHFVKTGIFDREMGKALNDAYDKKVDRRLWYLDCSVHSSNKQVCG